MLLGTIERSNKPAAQGPVALVPLGGGAVGIAPRVGGIIERGSVDQRPIHKIAARVVRVFVGVEDVDNTEFADCKDKPVGGLASGKLVDASIHLLRFPAQIDRLANEGARQPGIRIGLADLVGLAAGKSGDAERVRRSQIPDRSPG